MKTKALNTHKSKRSGKVTNISAKALRVEIRVSNHAIIFKMPGTAFHRMMDFLTSKFQYDYFTDKNVNSTDGYMLRPPWERKNMPMEPAKKLLFYRKEQNMTQKSLAEEVRTTQGNIASMENGSRPIGKGIAKRIGAALDVDYRVFLN